jgi:hypothetical protein
MAGKSKFGKLKPLVRAAWEEGKADKAIARETGVPISTVKRWCRSFAADPDLDPDPVETPVNPRFLRKAPPSRDTPQPPTKSNVVSIDGGRAHAAAYLDAKKITISIMKDVNQPGAVRIQAVNAMTKLLDLSARLPRHILMEEEQHSLGASVEEVEGRGDEQIAQDYRELLG